MSNKFVVPAIYRHYSDEKLYEVIGTCFNDGTGYVIFRLLQPNPKPQYLNYSLEYFTEMVGEGLNQVPRFQYYSPIPIATPAMQSSRLSIDEFFAIAGKESWWMDWETWRNLINRFTTEEILDDDSGYYAVEVMGTLTAREGYNRCTVKRVASEPPKWQSVANAPAAKDSPHTDENGVIQSGPYKGDTLVTVKPATVNLADKVLIDTLNKWQPVAEDKAFENGVVKTAESFAAKHIMVVPIDGSKHEYLRLLLKPRARLAAADWITKNGQTHTVDKGTLVEYEPGWKNVSSLTTDDGTVSVYWVEATILEGPHQGEKITVTSLNLAAENV